MVFLYLNAVGSTVASAHRGLENASSVCQGAPAVGANYKALEHVSTTAQVRRVLDWLQKYPPGKTPHKADPGDLISLRDNPVY